MDYTRTMELENILCLYHVPDGSWGMFACVCPACIRQSERVAHKANPYLEKPVEDNFYEDLLKIYSVAGPSNE